MTFLSFECALRSEELFTYFSLELDIKFKKHLKSFSIKEGENATLECEINTNKPVLAEWLHYGQPVIPTHRINVVRNGGKLQLLLNQITVRFVFRFNFPTVRKFLKTYVVVNINAVFMKN